MHGADAALLQPRFDAEIEVWGIDADEYVGLPRQHALAEFAAQFQQARQVAQYFGQPHHRQFTGVVPGLAACMAHGVATDTGEFRIREVHAQCFDQSSAQAIARGFAGNQGDAFRGMRGQCG